MKYTILVLAIVLFQANLFGQTTEVDWKKVVITKDAEDVKGSKLIGEISAETSKLFGGESKLREETTVKIQKEAAKRGANVVLIQVDNYATSPMTSVNMVGTGYFSNKILKKDNKAKDNPKVETKADIAEVAWEKVIVTRNPDDIKGRKRVGEISAETGKLLGNQSKLREETTIKIKKEAAKLGATIVLIQADDFVTESVNSVNMKGVAYE